MPQLQTRVRNLDPYRAFVVKKFPPPNDKWPMVKGEYVYKMEGVPSSKKDAFMGVTIRTIHEINKEDMWFAGQNFRVMMMTTSPPLWPIVAGNAITKLYVIKACREEFPSALHVKLVRGCRYLNADTILVRKKNDRDWEWKPLEKFLLDFLELEGQSLDAESAQRTWWKLNGQHFLLMKLPAKLCQEIYQ
jgi:hypothetical protein